MVGPPGLGELIAVGGGSLPVKLLVYATVVITVLSGVDYFLGLRRETHASDVRAAPPRERPPRAGAVD